MGTSSGCPFLERGVARSQALRGDAGDDNEHADEDRQVTGAGVQSCGMREEVDDEAEREECQAEASESGHAASVPRLGTICQESI